MGKSINELFGVDFNAKSFIALSNSVVSENLVQRVERKISVINERAKGISERYPTVAPPQATDISQINKKFAHYKSENNLSNDFFSDKEIRYMCYFANQIAKTGYGRCCFHFQ